LLLYGFIAIFGLTPFTPELVDVPVVFKGGIAGFTKIFEGTIVVRT
jgi:hypothetical protein